MKSRADKHPTWTSLVLAALVAADDFMKPEELRMLVRSRDIDQITAALAGLRKYDAVDSVVGGDGKLWWFATGDDKRSRTVEERIVEPVGNRSRKGTHRKPKVLKPLEGD